MNEKKSRRLRQLVRHLMSAGKIEENNWLNYGREQKYVEIELPDSSAPTAFDDEGKLIMTKKKHLVATGTRMMDPGCGRAIYQKMKNRADRSGR